ncbi:MAG TPA: hypothetical protein PK830_04665 [Candidatus Atribacteria bacterium]|mgnify:CR=1 FL=1|nr:hypothetical protein [Candidatus Atribacteria bacterium]HPT78378.1 hypothetical protein [Candidatus Atribacteria bacterium]
MAELVLAAAALAASYIINKLLLRLLREKAVIYGAPFFEELFKTLPAYFLNRPLLHVHILFGLGEAIYDFFSSRRETGRWAALVSLLSHSAFGGLTCLLFSLTGTIYPALAGAVLAHCAWNYIIMKK